MSLPETVEHTEPEQLVGSEFTVEYQDTLKNRHVTVYLRVSGVQNQNYKHPRLMLMIDYVEDDNGDVLSYRNVSETNLHRKLNDTVLSPKYEFEWSYRSYLD